MTTMQENKTAKSGFRFSTMIQKLGPLLGLIILILIVSVLNPSFLEPLNILNLLRQVSINALIAFGMTFVILTGGIDLSVGSILALSSAFVANMMLSGLDPILSIIIGVALGGVMGMVNGLMITKGRMAPFIATLATMTIFRGLTLVYTNGNPITGLGDNLLFQLFGRGYLLGIPVPAITMLITFMILWIVLHKTAFGRKTYAIGGNEKASIISGIKVSRVKIMIYSLTGMLAALAGAILTSRLNSAQPTAGTSYELDAIAAVVLGGTSLAGGRGRIVGTLIGVLIIGVLNNGLNLLEVNSFYQMVVKGIVIAIAVLLDRKKQHKERIDMKKWTLTLVSMLMIIALAGCSLEPPEWAKPDPSKSNGQKKIGLSISTLNNPFFVSLKDGVMAEAKNREYRSLSLMHRMIQPNKPMMWMILFSKESVLF